MSKKRGNNDGSVRQRKDGTWEARFIVGRKADGKLDRRIVYASTQKEVLSKMKQAQADILKDEYIAPSAITVEQWLDSWYRTYLKTNVRPSTASTTYRAIRNHLKPALGKYKLQQLRTEHIQAFIIDQQKNGLRASTIKRNVAPLKTALKQAVQNRLIVRNPADYIKLPKQEQSEIQFLTRDEQKALLELLPNTTNGRAIRFILGTGLRVGELCALRWSDINSDYFTVSQTASIYHDDEAGKTVIDFNAPKTKAGKRSIPLLPSMKTLLSEQRHSQLKRRLKAGSAWTGCRTDQNDNYVFASMVGTALDRDNKGRFLHTYLKKVGLSSRGIHTLRHTFATNWVQSGGDIRSLSEILGHTNVAFTMQTYVHSDMSIKWLEWRSWKRRYTEK